MKQTVAQTTAFRDGTKMKVAVGDREILLANVGGQFFAVSSKCTHMGGSLVDGELEGFSVVCPKHGTAFDLRTGEVSRPGKLAFIKVNPKALRIYPVTIEGTDILVELD